MIPIRGVLGTFGTVTKKTEKKKRWESNGIETKIDKLQKSVILTMATILRKVPEVWEDLPSPNFWRTKIPLKVKCARTENIIRNISILCRTHN